MVQKFQYPNTSGTEISVPIYKWYRNFSTHMQVVQKFQFPYTIGTEISVPIYVRTIGTEISVPI